MYSRIAVNTLPKDHFWSLINDIFSVKIMVKKNLNRNLKIKRNYFHIGKLSRLLLRRVNEVMVQHHFAERRLSKLNTILKAGESTKRKVEISVIEELVHSI